MIGEDNTTLAAQAFFEIIFAQLAHEYKKAGDEKANLEQVYVEQLFQLLKHLKATAGKLKSEIPEDEKEQLLLSMINKDLRNSFDFVLNSGLSNSWTHDSSVLSLMLDAVHALKTKD